MPDSFGKRARREVNAKNAASREARRIARNQRKKDRAAGIDVLPPGVEDALVEEPSDVEGARESENGERESGSDETG